MVSKLSILGLVASFAPFVSAVQFETPSNVHSSTPITIKWTSEASDPPTWTLELIHEAFRRSYALSNNVDGTTGQISLLLPVVPALSGYTLEAVDVVNINQVYGTSGQFTIEEAISSAESPSATAAPTPSGNSPSANPGPSQPTVKPPGQSASQFGTIVKPSNQGPATNSASPSGSGSGRGPVPSTINGGVRSAASYLVVAASVFLGALAVGA